MDQKNREQRNKTIAERSVEIIIPPPPNAEFPPPPNAEFGSDYNTASERSDESDYSEYDMEDDLDFLEEEMFGFDDSWDPWTIQEYIEGLEY